VRRSQHRTKVSWLRRPFPSGVSKSRVVTGLATEDSRMRLRLAAAVLALLLIGAPALAQVVLDAKPTVKVASGEDGTERVLVSDRRRPGSSSSSEVVGLVVAGQPRLGHSVSGVFHYFVAPAGGGYVKVVDSKWITESPRHPGPRCRYMEHLNLWLGTITYWSGSDEFHLHADELSKR
jgi:hypothetical protein